ncbi:hypothetical protein CLV58_101194 [Spirosoma oryzae]|uniref:Uncharacterized protein n=1 Tax=Spirosoma oryzae TaxID=1469603 RepID=A0A2T0TNL8_9BACT|nr:DUF6712 family protein [Spirosoma oryzae]PRY47128.1 hypothetical protein CLV58_101194 [Spirosoma oryzae]
MVELVTVETLKRELGAVQAKLSLATVEPFVKSGLRWFRREVGADLLEHLEDLANLPVGAGAEAELLELAQACVSWYAYDLAFPHLKLRVGDLGMTKANPNNTTPVTKWEYLDSREANLAMVDRSLEDFFGELERIRPASWTGSEAYKERNRVFIRSAWELARYVPSMGKNTRFFSGLVTYVERAETLYLLPLLGDSVFADLKAKYRDPSGLPLTLTVAEKALLNELLPALAHAAIFEALPYLPLNVSPSGISEQRSKDGTIEQVAPGAGTRDSLRRQFLADASTYLARAKNYLDKTASPSLFPGYYAANQSDPQAEPDFTNSDLIIL